MASARCDTEAVDLVKLRAWWAHRQGLDGSLDGSDPGVVLARTGWARSVGGVNPYLTLFSRAGTARSDVDRAVADLAVHELPAARGCTYVVPAAHFALALTVGAGFAGVDVAKVEKLGVPRAEIDQLCDAVVRTLTDEGPLDPRGLRTVLGDAVRGLGDEGKKKGVTTTLPVALGLLQARGEIRRVPLEGRLDRQRFAYAHWSPSPRADFTLTPAQARTELARLYWTWTGGATMKQFRWFSAFTVAFAGAAAEPLGLTPLAGTDVLALPDDAKAYEEFTPPATPRYAVVAWIDGISLLRRDLASLLDESDAARDLGAIDKRALGALSDLPAQGIVDRGRLVGLWDFDPDAGEIVWTSFAPADDALRGEVARTEAYVRDQLGDARGGSLDTPSSRRPRLDALRAMGH